MPCRDYLADVQVPGISVQQKLDMLSRIACKALTHIEETNNGLEFLILKDPEIAAWWSAHKEADRQEQEQKAVREKREKMTRTALDKLTSALGLR